jgi:mRNA-degrading endonuclease YafQ of YafQ-DinJ toxin-antitoxin module
LKNSANFDKDFKLLLKKHPKVIEVLPVLIAVRTKKIRIVEVLSSKSSLHNFSFDTTIKDDEQIEQIYPSAPNRA